MGESGDKTEEPTHKKLEDARKKGNVFKSKELSGILGFIVALGALNATTDNLQSEFTHILEHAFDVVAHPRDMRAAFLGMFVLGVRTLMVLTCPVIGAAIVVGVLVEAVQVRGLITLDPIMPKFDKLNPIQGLKNMFGPQKLIELAKNLLKLFLTFYMSYGAVKGALGLIATQVNGTPLENMIVLGELVRRVVIRVSAVFVALAMLDLFLQHRKYMKDLRMSKEEVKREYKESEGDPHHKAKRKQFHREILESAATNSVKKASVVVTNPDHVAVALQYDRERDVAPVVVAKGLDADAEVIRDAAAELGVPLMRNVPLAHALLHVEVGEPVPAELYDAVAEVLNFVYGLSADLYSGAHA